MNDTTLQEVKETLVAMLGDMNFLDSNEVWEKISSFKNWKIEKPSSFAIQGRIIESEDKKLIEVDSISIPGVDTVSFSYQKTYPRESHNLNEGYAFYVRYPQRLLVIVADTFKPLAKVVSMVDGSVTMSSL